MFICIDTGFKFLGLLLHYTMNIHPTQPTLEQHVPPKPALILQLQYSAPPTMSSLQQYSSQRSTHYSNRTLLTMSFLLHIYSAQLCACYCNMPSKDALAIIIHSQSAHATAIYSSNNTPPYGVAIYPPSAVGCVFLIHKRNISFQK